MELRLVRFDRGHLFAVQKPARTQDTPLTNIRNRHGTQEQVNLIAQFFPKIVRYAATGCAGTALRRTRAAARRPDWFVNGEYNIRYPGVFRATRKEITSSRPSNAPNLSPAPELREELFQI